MPIRFDGTLNMVKPGDVLEFRSTSCFGRLITLCTLGSQHVGVVTRHPEDSRLVVWESTMSLPLPCLFAGRRVRGVGCRLLRRRVLYELHRNGYVWIHPLVTPLDGYESRMLAMVCYNTRGTPYDWWGAFQSRTLGGRYLTRRIVPSVEDAKSLYCNEAVAFWLREVGRFKRDNAAAFNPRTFLKAQHEDGMHEEPIELKLNSL